jgi:hypothetical protein
MNEKGNEKEQREDKPNVKENTHGMNEKGDEK